MSAVTFTPGIYYRHLCAAGESTLFLVYDVENYPVAVPLGNNEIVYCAEIVRRSGGKGRGLYAKLLSKRGEHEAVLYHRVSKNHIGSGDWEEVNAMVVLALVDDLPFG
jgi:hypothetical protein